MGRILHLFVRQQAKESVKKGYFVLKILKKVVTLFADWLQTHL